MNEPKDNPPAFPLLNDSEGMSLRDYFAAKALYGLLAHHGDSGWHPDADIASRFGAATSCYEYADAMLRARKEGQ